MDDNTPSAEEVEYRELSEKLRRSTAFDVMPSKDLKRMIELSQVGRKAGWLKPEHPSPTDAAGEGGAWRRTNPPKKGKPAKPGWYK